MLEWLGLDRASQFDPASFDVDEGNGALGLVAPRVAESGPGAILR
jgi:hypothetical protein